MSANTEQRKLAAIMFTDMVGYSALAQRDDKLALELLEEHRRLLREIFPSFNGTEIKTIGDGFLIEFHSALEAARCAIEMQRALAKRNHDVVAERRIELRIGIHIGDVMHRGGDVYGDGVNIASRIEQLAAAGGICVSMDVERQIRNALEARLEKLAPTELKNISVPMDLFRIVLPWEHRAKAEPAERSVSGRSFPVSRLTWAGAIVLVAVAVGWWLAYQSGRTTKQGASLPGISKSQATSSTAPVTDQKSIAVLPFENLSRDPDNAYFADGIQEEILTRLSKIADLKVISRTSTQRYKSKPDNLPEIAKQLGVAHILEGTVQKAADQVRVNVQLISAQNDSHLWADKFDRKLTDVFAVESEIASKIADLLQARLTGSAKQAIASRPTENAGAHELYLRGRYFVGKRGAENLNKAIDYFNQAIAKDPNYALAYAGLSDCYDLLPQWVAVDRAKYTSKAKATAIKALQIDDNLAEAHTSLAAALFSNDLNLPESKREFERAIELDPNYAFAHYTFGYTVLPALSEFDRAIAEVRRAVELDPFSTIINANLGYLYIVARRYPEAIAQLQKTLELDPNFGLTHRNLGETLELSGQLEQAIAEYEKAYKLRTDEHALAYLAHAYALKGEHEKTSQLLTQMKEFEQRGPLWAFGFALVYVGLGDRNEAINWLERSYQNREFAKLSLIKVEPMLDPLRGDPRFEALVEKIIPAREFKSQAASK